MPSVERPGGVAIHWEAQGEGPLVVIVPQMLWSRPGIYADLVADLARDHRVVLYDPRGCGRSTRQGPYDIPTDAEDLLAVIAAAGGPALPIAVGYGYNVVARASSVRPAAISDVIALMPAAAAMLPRSELKDSDLMGASDSVVEMMLQLMRADPRAALRTMIAATNPNIDEHQLRERVESAAAYIGPGVATERATAWLADDPSAHASTLGGRLTVVYGQAEPLFEGALLDRVRDAYPEARLVQLEDGPVTRPDLTAALVRRISNDSSPE
jgi:pimeloyl-ACP methyl ester carboxylesterase